MHWTVADQQQNVVTTDANQNVSTETSREVTLDINGAYKNGKRYRLDQVRTARALDLPMQTITISELNSRHRHLRGLPFQQFENAIPKILIGLAHSHQLPSAIRKGGAVEPTAYETKLGWVIFGPQGSNNTHEDPQRLLHYHEVNNSLRITTSPKTSASDYQLTLSSPMTMLALGRFFTHRQSELALSSRPEYFEAQTKCPFPIVTRWLEDAILQYCEKCHTMKGMVIFIKIKLIATC